MSIRHRVWVAGLAGAIVSFAAGAITPPEARAIPFLSYQFRATADAYNQTGGSKASQGFPQQAAQAAHTVAFLDTGPNGQSLASSAWPGDFVGNVGSLAQVFGAPPEAGGLNSPVRAQASSSGTKEQETVPGMRATADGPTAEAAATVDGSTIEGLTKVGDIVARSSTKLVGEQGAAFASASVSNIDIGGGVITIESVVTDAAATTNAVTGTSSGHTVVSGAAVGGQPVTIDETGVHVANQSSPAAAAAQQQVNAVLANFAQAFTLTMYVTAPSQTRQGARQEYTSGALVITFNIGGDEGGTATYVLGGSSVSVQATPGLPDPANDAVPATDASTPLVDGSTSSGSTGGDEAASPSGPGETIAADPGAASGDDPVAVGAIAALGRFGGVPFGLPLTILLLSLLGGWWLDRLYTRWTEAPVGVDCPDQEVS